MSIEDLNRIVFKEPLAHEAVDIGSSMDRSSSTPGKKSVDFKVSNSCRKATLSKDPGSESLGEWKLITGNSNIQLAEKVAENLGVKLTPIRCTKFNDGECNIQIIPSVRNLHVYVVQSTAPSRDGKMSINDHVMELFLLVRCLRRASAGAVTAIIPYFGYSRQNQKRRPRVPIAASDIAMLLEAGGIDRVVTIDLHVPQIQGQFQHSPVDNLSMFDDFAVFFFEQLFTKLGVEDEIAIVSPDAGGVGRAKFFMGLLLDLGVAGERLSMAITIRQMTASTITVNMVGDVEGKHCVIIDDIIDTGVRVCTTADALLDLGAKTVGVIATHGLFTGKALIKIEASEIDYCLVSDTIALPIDANSITQKIIQVSCASIISEAIDAINHDDSVSHLFAIGRE